MVNILRPLILKVKELSYRLGLIADYVVEQGKSGIWTYRKWNSGIAECWTNIDFSVNVSGSYGAVYFGRLWNSLPLPPGLFIAIPVTHIKTHDDNATSWVLNNYYDTNNIGVASLICGGTGQVNGIASVNCIGNWK